MRKGGTKRHLVVRLRAADRRQIEGMLRGGIEPVRVIKRAQVLRLLDQDTGPPQVAQALGVSPQTVRNIGWRYVEEGLERRSMKSLGQATSRPSALGRRSASWPWSAVRHLRGGPAGACG
jgi:Winged helix-turn helix